MGKGDPPAAPLAQGSLKERIEALERQIIQDSYSRYGTTVAVAEDLGISQATAARKVGKYIAHRKKQTDYSILNQKKE